MLCLLVNRYGREATRLSVFLSGVQTGTHAEGIRLCSCVADQPPPHPSLSPEWG
jgi:hypothetical protein